jgi:serine/threonine-protein kinase
MGKVYEAKHVRLPRHFAIKVIRDERVTDGQTLDRFRREAEITSSLGCVHIIDVVDFSTLADGSPYFVMELLVGENLATRMERLGALSRPAIHKILSQVVAGLSAAHLRGVLHRDIKPENIFLCQTPDHGELVKVLDFGLSKLMGGNKTPTRTLMGTPYYMSPEQARGDAVDVRSDVYALGVMAYQLLTQRFPFEGETTYEVLTKIALRDPTPPSQWVPGLAGPIEEVLLAAIAKDPAQRTPSVDAFWAAFEPALLAPAPIPLSEVASAPFADAGLTAETVQSPAPVPLLPPAPRVGAAAIPGPRESVSRTPGATPLQNRPLLWLAVGVALAAALGLSLAMRRPPPPSEEPPASEAVVPLPAPPPAQVETPVAAPVHPAVVTAPPPAVRSSIPPAHDAPKKARPHPPPAAAKPGVGIIENL